MDLDQRRIWAGTSDAINPEILSIRASALPGLKLSCKCTLYRCTKEALNTGFSNNFRIRKVDQAGCS